jgi:hypothetical protein
MGVCHPFSIGAMGRKLEYSIISWFCLWIIVSLKATWGSKRLVNKYTKFTDLVVSNPSL